jgi:nitroreductase
MFDTAQIDHLLSTTRSVRKRLDFTRPVEPELIERCIELAIQAPSGSDRQRWHFVIVTDPELRRGVGEYYRRSFMSYYESRRAAAGAGAPVTPIEESSLYLADHMHEAPALAIFCYEGRVEQQGAMAQAAQYGSILPAAWSFMLALRSRGLGTAWTTLHLRYEREVAELLGIPSDMTQAVLFPIAYYTGDDFRPAKRTPAVERTSWDGWGKRRAGDE